MGAHRGRGRRARGPGGLHAHLGEGGGHIWAPPGPPPVPPEPTHGCCPPVSSRIPPVAPATAAHGACRGWDGGPEFLGGAEGSPNLPVHP